MMSASDNGWPNVGTFGESVTARLALPPEGWDMPTAPGTLRPVYLFCNSLLQGHYILSVTGTAGAVRIWPSNSTNGVPLLISGQTITNGIPVTFANPGNVAEVWLEAVSNGVAKLTFSFEGTGNATGFNHADTLDIMVHEVIAEPISLPSVTNAPAQFPVGSNATYTVTVSDFIPGTDITWSNSSPNAVSFVNGNTGRSVTVKGESIGETKLTVHIKGFSGQPPEFNVKVMDLQDVYADVWVVCDSNGVPCVSASYVTNRFDEANIWLSQGGMMLRARSISFTNRQDWLTMPSSAVANANFTPIPHDGTALKIVFVNRIIGARGFNNVYCIGIGTNATTVTLAHEVCHAGGLRDIYPEQDGLSITDAGVVQAGHLDPKDWGTGYYQADLLHTNLITRLLMYYTHHPNRGHIPHGKVYGVHRPIPGAPLTTGNAPVGLDTLNQHPVHLKPPSPQP